jgi:hypothetical protein
MTKEDDAGAFANQISHNYLYLLTLLRLIANFFADFKPRHKILPTIEEIKLD